MNYNRKTIYKLLTEGFSAQKLKRFCMLNAEFREARLNLSDEPTLNQVVDTLIAFAEQKNLMPKLLLWAKEENRLKYNQFKPYTLDSSAISTESLPPRISMASPPPADFVARPEIYEAAISHLLTPNTPQPVALSTALQGAGGYGKNRG